MKYIFSLLAIMAMAVTSVGCSTVSKPKPIIVKNYEHSLDTGPYLRMFQTEMAARQINIMYPMELRVYISRNLNKKYRGVAGLCSKWSNKIRIYLDEGIWLRLDDIGREMLIFHELGHCVLGLEHNNATDVRGMPLSIMHSGLFDPRSYSDYRPHYLDALAQQWMAIYGPRFNMEDLLDNIPQDGEMKVLRLNKSFKKRYSIP